MKKISSTFLKLSFLFLVLTSGSFLFSQNPVDLYAFENASNVSKISTVPNVTKVNKTDIRAVNEVRSHLASHIQYPAIAETYEISGRILLAIEVDMEGIILNTHIIEGMSSSFDKEALKALSSLKKVSPIYLNGRKQAKTIVVPIVFKAY